MLNLSENSFSTQAIPGTVGQGHGGSGNGAALSTRFFARIESNSLNTYSSEINREQEKRSQEELVITFTVP